MWFWWFILAFDLLIPLMMIVIGRLTWKHPPKEINALIGYRTSRSMKNLDTWRFAHHRFGKLMWIFGWGILLPSFLVHLPFYGATENVLGNLCIVVLLIQLFPLLAAIFMTEKALRKTFTDEGIYKV